jgi:heterodisulfide reductase subunit C
MMATEMHPFLVEVLNTPGGEDVLQCYQCGTCSGSCPVIDEMEHGPRRIMHLIHSGEEELVLSSHDMWFCVSCYSCANRCPRGIEITDVMASLRSLAMQKGYTDDKEAKFGKSFAETVKHHGRMFEPELMIRYYLRSMDIPGLLGMIPLGIQMLLKNKLPFVPARIENPEDLDGVCAAPEGAASSNEDGRGRWLPWLFGSLAALVGAGTGSLLWFLGGRKEKN